MSNNIIPTNNSIEAVDDPEKLYHEINLLRIEGYYFCFDKKITKNATKHTVSEEIKTPDGTVRKEIILVPHKEYGRPSVLAYKILQATLKKYSEYSLPYPEGVHFTQRELARLIGRSSFGGWDTKKFIKAIMQLKSTEITFSFFFKKTKEWQMLTINIFHETLLKGRGNVITDLVLSLHPRFVESLSHRYAFCLNYDRMDKLEPIGVILFKRLFFYFSNIYSKNKRNDLIYTKDYADICEQWLGGLKVLKYKSKIMNEQLGNHLRALKESGLIKKVEVVKNELDDGFNLMFYPGKGFFDDYRRFYGEFLQLALPIRQKHEERYIKNPMVLVQYFYKKLFGKDEIDENILDASEVESASLLLEEHSFDDIKAWIDYSIQQAKKTSFEMKKFGGIKNYKTEFFIKQAQEKQKIVQQEKQNDRWAKEKERQRMEGIYRDYRLEKVATFKNTLSPEALKAIESSVQTEEAGKTDPNRPWFSAIVRYAVDSRLAKLAKVPSFDEWVEKQGK